VYLPIVGEDEFARFLTRGKIPQKERSSGGKGRRLGEKKQNEGGREGSRMEGGVRGIFFSCEGKESCVRKEEFGTWYGMLEAGPLAC